MTFHFYIIIAEVVVVSAYLLFLLAKKDRTAATIILAAALVAITALDFLDFQAILHPQHLLFWKKNSLWAEAFIPLVWLAFSLFFARENGFRDSAGWQKLLLALTLIFPAMVAAIPVGSFFFSPDFAEELILFLGNPGYFFYLGILLYLILALFNLESTLRNSSRPDRWKIKYEIVGVGLMITIFIVYFSQSLLYRSLDMSLLPARSLILILAVGLMAFSRFRSGEMPAIRLSKDMAFRSVVVFAVGLYLIGLGFFGEGLRYFGEDSRRIFYIILALLGGGGIVIIFLSEKVKGKIFVFLHKNFLKAKFDYRQQWLNFTQAISDKTSQEDLYRAILSFFCETFALKGAAIFMAEGRDFHCAEFFEYRPALDKVRFSAPVREQLEDKDRIIDFTHGEGGEDFPAIYPSSRATCLVPLYSGTRLEGFIILGERINPGEEIIYEDYDLMKVLARQATSAILNFRLSEQISATRQMEIMARVSTFVLHDLKNLVSNLALVVDNAENYLSEPEFQQDMLTTLRSTTKKMKDLIERLKNLREKGILDRRPCSLQELANQVIQAVGTTQVKVSGQDAVAEVDTEEIQKVILNLVLNGLDAGDHRAPVEIEIGEDNEPYIRVSDNGCGMTEDFIRNRLFKPFETTKTNGFGIGLYQCKQIVDAHGGRIDVYSQPGEGTRFTVWLPGPDDISVRPDQNIGLNRQKSRNVRSRSMG